MLGPLKDKIIKALRWSEKYTKTDMVYVASGQFWFFVGRSIAVGSGFILTIGFANLLSPTDYGVYKYILASAGIVTAFTLGGLPPAMQRALGKGYSNVIRPLVRYALWWNTPAVIIATAVGAYYFWNGNVQLGGSFLFIALSMCFSGLGVTKSFFMSTGEFSLATYFGTLRTIIPVALILGTLFLTKNVLAIVFVYFASQVVMNVITYHWSLRYIQPKEGDEFVSDSKRYSVYMSALASIQSVAQYADHFLLWHFLGPVALATYTIAQGPAKELHTLAGNAVTIAFPKFARQEARAHIDARTVPTRTKQLFILLCLVVLLYILAAPLLFKVFFPLYLDSVFYSQLIALGVLLQPRNLADAFLFAHSGIRDRYAILIPSSVIKIVLFAALIPPFGILGAIAATFIAELITTCIVFGLYWRFERNSSETPLA